MNPVLFWSATLHWLAILFYAIAILTNSVGILLDRSRWEHLGGLCMVAGLGGHGVGLLLRWLLVDHGPYIERLEVLSSNAWVGLALFGLFSRIYPKIKPAILLILPAVFLLLGLAMFQPAETSRMPPTMKNIWLVLHVSFYKLSLGTLLIALAFSLFYLHKRHRSANWHQRLPDLPTMDSFAYRFAGLGFLFWTIATLAGSIWAFDSWGRFWAWDPIETWSLLTWLSFGLYLHLRRFFHWQGQRAALLFLLCFSFSIISLFGVPLLDTTLHSEYFR